MKLRSHIDFPAFIFRQYNPLGELNVAVTISALFDIPDGRSLRAAPEQREIQKSDEYTGPTEPTRHLLRQADFVPYKMGTDVTAIAKAWSPSGTPEKSWLAGIRVASKDKLLRIHGPRDWYYHSKDGWQLTQAGPAESVPLDYYHAFGGKVPINDEDTINVNSFNPLGPGIIDVETADRSGQYMAPQIEDRAVPIESASEEYVPQGLAPIHPAWRFRQQYAGTYDKDWIDTQHPFLPPDFDYHFYNCAHPDMIFKPYLQGNEIIQLANLHPHHKQMHFALPNKHWGTVASYKNGSTVRSAMVLDGVHFELLQTIPKVRITWRAAFPWGRGIDFIDIGQVENPFLQSSETEGTTL